MNKLAVLLGSLILISLTVICSSEAVTRLSFNERVAYQKAIEEVYWKHTIWPADNPQPKPALEAVLPDSAILAKTEEYLRKANALDLYWHMAITPEQLQAEVNRMAKQTRDASVLRELWRVLENDPYLVAECLARPVLVERISDKLDGFEEWWRSEGKYYQQLPDVPLYSYRLPKIKGGTAFDLSAQPITEPSASDSWTATTTTGAPLPRIRHTAVWTGTQMIVWGGTNNLTAVNTGGRYTPSNDIWNATTTTGAPTARENHTAIWSGTQMIVWGGAKGTTLVPAAGGRYDSSTDTWSAISTTGAPVARYNHTAVWTGSLMMVWGGRGSGGVLNTGGRYAPLSNTWSTVTTTGAPSARELHTAVYSGTYMIVWGGASSSFFNTGGRYNPSTETWTATATTGAPSARLLHTGIWTSTQMIIWGGINTSNLNTGGRYTP